MRERVYAEPGTVRRLAFALFSFALLLSGAAPAGAQTVVLDHSSATTLRAGRYANTNLNGAGTLHTKNDPNPDYVRRTLLKFDTHNTIPAGASIASAELTLTVAGGSATSARPVAAYYVPVSYDERAATWMQRKSGIRWDTAGGELKVKVAQTSVPATRGTRVKFDVTSLVRDLVAGRHGSSRWARFMLVDVGTKSSGADRAYYSDRADTSLRPRLTVQLGSGSTPVAQPSSSSGATLKVLDWNIHHGVGTDGKYNITRIASVIAKSGAHVVSLNEVERYTGWGNEDQPARFAAMLKSLTGRTWYYHFAPRTGNSKGQGNLLLSVYRLDSKGTRLLSYSRSAAQVSITVNGRTVNVFSTHLDPDYASRRVTQMKELIGWSKNFAEQRIICGDMNAWYGSSEITVMTAGHYDAWAAAKQDGVAYAYPDNPNGNTRNSRIDYIFYSKGATRLVLKGAKVIDTRDSHGVRPSDHNPILANFEVR